MTNRQSDAPQFQTQLRLSGIKDAAARARQMLYIINIFGIFKVLKASYRHFTNKSNPVELEMSSLALRFPLHLRSTLDDMWVYVEVLRDGEYTVPKESEKKINSSVVVDIGAYNGTTTSFFASRYPLSKVIAIEPNPDNYKLLLKNVQNYGDQVLPINAAVSPLKGAIFRQELGGRPTDVMNAFIPLPPKSSSNTSVKSITPAEIITQLAGHKIGLLKVDIEGAEKQLFETPMIDELLRRTEVLLIEIHDGFMPGSSETVNLAAVRNGLNLSSSNPYTKLYIRKKL